jgi:N6-L-threonylcarbamoyladenine synthase
VVGPDGVCSDVIHTQHIHKDYGGVVPELAGRAHADQVVVTVQAALEQAGIDRPDAVGATSGPGLMGAVLVGLCFGKAAAAGWQVPFVGVNHLEGHLLAPLLEPNPPTYPFISLVVSGGHTALYLAEELGRYTLLGQTLDDAAGEAFDKVARMLDLGYPGGPAIDRLAEQGDPAAVSFPRPDPGRRAAGRPQRGWGAKKQGTVHRRRERLRRRPLDMSFSGLKTAVRVHLESDFRASDADVAASFREAVVDVLCDRVQRAMAQTGVDRICMGGGVAANGRLRERMAALSTNATIPSRARCTDNAAMIAHVGRLRLLVGQRDPLSTTARASWRPGEP